MSTRVLTLLTGLACTVALAGCSVPFTQRPHVVTAEFRDTAGLYVGNDVRVLGMPVGKVTRIKPGGGSVTVTFELDPDVNIPVDAKAVTVAPSVVTDRHVEMVPAWTSGPTLPDGARIPLARTRTPVEIDEVVRSAKVLADALDEQGGVAPINDLMHATTGMVGGNGKQFRHLLTNAAQLSDLGVDNRESMADLVRGMDELMAAAAKNDRRITSFSQDLTETTDLFADEAPGLAKTIRDILVLLRAASKILGRNHQKMTRSLANFRVITRTVASRPHEVAESTDVLPLLFENSFRMMDIENKAMRAHALGIDSLLQTELIGALCPFIPTLSGCLLPPLTGASVAQSEAAGAPEEPKAATSAPKLGIGGVQPTELVESLCPLIPSLSGCQVPALPGLPALGRGAAR